MSPSNRCRRALDFFAHSPLIALAGVATATLALIASGCSLNKDQFRAEKVIARIGRGGDGQIIEPRRCLMEIAIITRPIRDKSINESVWNVADVQCVPEEARRALESNGVRIGKIAGALPTELESALHAPPPHKVKPISYLPETKEPVGIRTAESVPQLSLLMNRDDRAFGKDYEQASGYLRVTSDHDGERGVSLRIVPEIHHGPVKQSYQAIPNPGAYPLNQMTPKLSQQEDSLLELAATTILQPGEVAVMTCDVDRDRTLGSFLFTLTEANTDRKMQHLVLIWASRNLSGTIDADKLHSSVDRPRESRTDKPDAKKDEKEKVEDDSPKKDVILKDKDTPAPS